MLFISFFLVTQLCQFNTDQFQPAQLMNIDKITDIIQEMQWYNFLLPYSFKLSEYRVILVLVFLLIFFFFSYCIVEKLKRKLLVSWSYSERWQSHKVGIVLLQKQTFETTDTQLRLFDWAGDFKDE